MKLTTYLHLVPRSRIRGVIPQLPHYALTALCSVEESSGTTLPLPPPVTEQDMRVYPKVSGLAAWGENYKWYSSLSLGAVISLFCESVLVSFAAINLCVAS
jgi:hypothetical protein